MCLLILHSSHSQLSIMVGAGGGVVETDQGWEAQRRGLRYQLSNLPNEVTFCKFLSTSGLRVPHP